jgi:hypothetical protein
METNFIKNWMALLCMALVAMFSPANITAAETDDTQFGNAIVAEGSIPLTWNNDATYPWTIQDDYARCGNIGARYSSSSLSFSFSSQYQTEVSFDWWITYSNNLHTFKCYVDGVENASAPGSRTNKRMYLNAGTHVIELRDSVGNLSYTDVYSTLANVKVTEIKDIDKTLLTSRSMPLTFENDATYPWIVSNGSVHSTNYEASKSSSTIKTSFTIDKVSKLSFERYVGESTTNHNMSCYINGKLYNTTNSATSWSYVSAVLQPGTYTVEWVDNNTYAYSGNNTYVSYLRNVELHQDWIEVDVTPGMLGVEVLYKVDVLKDVQLLKVNGTINSTDWTTIGNMTGLHAIDMGNAASTNVPDNAFNGLSHLSTAILPPSATSIGSNAFHGTNLHYISIPAAVKSIGIEAFSYTPLETISFESGSVLKSIGYQAFGYCTNLSEFVMPNTVKSLGRYGNYASDYESATFRNCTSLKRLIFSDSITVIPYSTCSEASALTELKLPAMLTNIEQSAFYNTQSLSTVDFPTTLSIIQSNAFYKSGLTEVRLPLKLQTLGDNAFQSCSKLKYVELPSNITAYNRNFNNCSAITKIVCRAATPPAISSDPFSGLTKSNATLVVPSFAVVNYKLDSYWYQFGEIAEGDDVDYWMISGALSLINNRRMDGTPDIDLTYGGRLTVSGNAPMTVGNMNIYISEANPSRLLNSCPTFTATNLSTRFKVSANTWYFITPMADINLSDITVTGTSSYVFRYYDGAKRAASGTGSSWQNVTESVLHAGQGYIFQCNAEGEIVMPVASAHHEQILSDGATSIALTAHNSDNTANKGWNYVGNPYPCYYDIYYMDFTAPITVWTGSTYRAYSIADDNYVLRPMQGFFVQKPDAVDAISMPLSGKQLESTINRVTSAPAMHSSATRRTLFDIAISADTLSDMTRVILNDEASMHYEIECDATKFMSIDSNVPQLYSIDSDANRLAINERPESDGSVSLGIYTPTTDIHTISATRHDGEIYLHDAVTGATVNLAESDYSFTPESIGSDDTRFTLTLSSPAMSGISDTHTATSITTDGRTIIVSSDTTAAISIYGIDGTLRYSATAYPGNVRIDIPTPGAYLVKNGNEKAKLVIIK